MKITKVDTFVVALPPRRPHKTATRADTLGRYTIVEVHTDEDIVGLGEATVLKEWGGDHGKYFGEAPELTARVIDGILGPSLIGLDPFNIETANLQMDLVVKGYPYAKAALDIALHDIKGKALGVPVYQLLGGLFRREIPLAHSLGHLPYEQAVSEASEAVEDGIKTIKCKIGRDAEYDVRVVREVRAALGDGITVTVDANQAWPTPKYAITLIHRLEDLGVKFVEQPVEGLARMAQVAQAVDMPIMADESAWTPQDVLEIVERRAADLISLYTTKPGGLFKAKKVAAVAEAAGLPMNVNGSHETGIGNAANLHLVASTRAVTESGVFPVTTLQDREQTKMAGRAYLDDIITEPFPYRDGCLIVPDGPGLGVTLDPAKVAKYRVK